MRCDASGKKMTKKRRVEESTIRECDFEHSKTVILLAGELDIYVPRGRHDLQIEVRVAMTPIKVGSSFSGLSFSGISLYNADGTRTPLVVVDEYDRPMDQEMSEVLAYEMIEYLDIAMTYIEGRSPAKNATGHLARTGEEIRAQLPELDEVFTL